MPNIPIFSLPNVETTVESHVAFLRDNFPVIYQVNITDNFSSTCILYVVHTWGYTFIRISYHSLEIQSCFGTCPALAPYKPPNSDMVVYIKGDYDSLDLPTTTDFLLTLIKNIVNTFLENAIK